jgi:DNA (cytosine-5)-methyltransferase 1
MGKAYDHKPAIGAVSKRPGDRSARLCAARTPAMMPRLLDLFCGAGGAGHGYALAGFDVTGVDIKPQPLNPYKVILGDAMEYLTHHGNEYDAIHASPPCQAYSVATIARRKAGAAYPDLLAEVRVALNRLGVPWVIENVPGAPMRKDLEYCGCHFGLWRLRRRRWFETSWRAFDLTPPCRHSGGCISVVGGCGNRGEKERFGRSTNLADWRRAMGIDWMGVKELSQAIPPAYTERIGALLLKELEGIGAKAGISIDRDKRRHGNGEAWKWGDTRSTSRGSPSVH